MKINKSYLLILAALVWLIAGFNVLKIGIQSYNGYLNLINIFLSLIIFGLFHFLVFQKMVKKHSQRINSYADKQYFWKFFDLKSFLIMFFMMSFGISIRVFNLLPESFIAVFYTGLGLALFLAGISFGINYLRTLNFRKEEIIMKKYVDSSIFYTCLALVMGVFYREFTKFNGFVGDSSLGVVHTHYLILGTFFFLILVILEKLFNISDYISNKLFQLYHIGLNLTCIMMIVRGIIQVNEFELSNMFNASIAGVAGIGHIVITIALIFMLSKIKKCVLNSSAN